MKDFFSQNWVSTLISMSGIIIGGILSFIFYKKSISKAIPVYQYSNHRILDNSKKVGINDISLYYKDKEIKLLTKTIVAFWNDGNKTIHGYDTVDKQRLRIVFENPDGKVLSAKVVKYTRDVINFRLDNQYDNNTIYFDFDFLDKNDGGIIEILHTFSSSELKILGVIKEIPEGLKDYGDIDELIIPSKYSGKFTYYTNKIINLINPTIKLLVYLTIGLISIITALNLPYFPNFFIITNGPSDFIFGIFGLIVIIGSIIEFLVVPKKRIPKELQIYEKL